MPNHPVLPVDLLWRDVHLGRLLARAAQRFNERVRTLVGSHPLAPLTLTRLAERDHIGSAQLHLLQHLPVGGERLTTLARTAGMTKQAMAAAVTQCAAWGLVEQQPDPDDRRARRIAFTPLGLTWLQVYREAVDQAQTEFREAVDEDVATVTQLGLEAYVGGG